MVENFNFQTIEEAKKYAAVQLKNYGIKNAAIDINAALKHILKCDEIYLITHKNYVLSDDEISQFKHFLKICQKGLYIKQVKSTHKNLLIFLNLYLNIIYQLFMYH